MILRKMNRKQIATKSSIISVSMQLLTIAVTFIIRKIFICYIGIVYLGLTTVLTDVLNMLSLSELGVQSAIVFRLYKPLIDNDQKTINEIMLLLKRIYKAIGLFIFGTGVILLPCLKYMISNVNISNQAIYLSFVILLVATCSSYFLSYRRALIYADQKHYIISLADGIVSILCGILRIIIIIVFNSLYFYLFVSLVQNIASNILLERYCKKHYRWLRTQGEIRSALRRSIYNDTKNVFASKLAGFVYGSTDNLIISAFISTVMIGYIGNYKSVTNVIKIVMNYMFLPIQPMIGNYLETEKKSASRILYDKYLFIRYIVACVLLIPLLLLTQGIIKAWLGAQYLLEWDIIFLIITDLYFSCIQGPAGEYITALGWFRFDRNISLIGAAANLLFSLRLIHEWGIKGVLIGTIISQMIMWQGKVFVILNKFFHFSKKEIIKNYLTEIFRILLFGIIFITCKIILECINLPDSIWGLSLQFVLIEVVVVLQIVLVYMRSRKRKYLVELFCDIKEMLESFRLSI